MRHDHRHWSCILWSVWIIVLAVGTAVVCASHPPTHDHEVPHPPLCTDSHSPMVLGEGIPLLVADGGTFPLPATWLLPYAVPVGPSAHLTISPWPLGPPRCWTEDSPSLRMPLQWCAVLRL